MNQNNTPSGEAHGIGRVVARLIEEGYEINIGAHSSFHGYFAIVYIADDQSVCDECEAPEVHDWHQSGHGWTILEALANAEDLAKGDNPETNYRPDDFRQREDSDES